MSMPITDPVAAGQQREADLQAIVDELNGPNPCAADMNLPPALTQDGGY
jgi:hypothetical protein